MNQSKLLAYRLVRNYINAEIALLEVGKQNENFQGHTEEFMTAFTIMLELLTKYKEKITE